MTRLLAIFVAWSLLFLLTPDDWNRSLVEHGVAGTLKRGWEQHVADWNRGPLIFLMRGSSFHLWFLMALALSFAVIAGAQRTRTTVALLPLAVLCHVWVVLYGAYDGLRPPPSGYPPLGTRSVLVGLLPVVAGWKLGRGDWRAPSVGVAVELGLLGAALHFPALHAHNGTFRVLSDR